MNAAAEALVTRRLEREAWEAAQAGYQARLAAAHAQRLPRFLLKALLRDARRIQRQVESARARELLSEREVAS